MKGLRIGGADYRTRRARKRTAIAAVILVLLVLSVCIIVGMKKENKPDILLQVKSGAILQEEEIPAMEVSVSSEKGSKSKEVLEKNYTVGRLVKDLKAGKGFQLVHEIDNQTEGSYPVKIVLEEKLAKKIKEAWKEKVTVHIKNGSLEVKNKYGTWEEDKFKRTDGSYVTSDFIVSKGEQYYFDQDGKMVTGEQMIDNQKYVFGEDGKLISKESRVDIEKPMIALTFDDGPGKYTDMLLQKLEEYDARATFFMLGQNAQQYPQTIQKMKAIGCELGNHSWSHTSLLKLDDAGVQNEINQTNDAIAAAVGTGATLVRPPYGDYDDRVRSLVGAPIAMWSVDTQDWKKKNTAAITEYVLNTAADGDIVLMHDIHDFSVNSALELIPILKERGFQLVTVSEMAEARGITLTQGERYSRFDKQ